jgi:hypothetical protein
MSRVIFSILLGLGIAYLFKLCCDSRPYIVYEAPIIRHKNKCYSATEKKETCDSSKIILDV